MGRDGIGRNYLVVGKRETEEEGRRRGRNAVGRGGISFGCDKDDMHVSLRNPIQLTGMGNRVQTRNKLAL